jgi:tRNA wybutosine-synthesizing protein 4
MLAHFKKLHASIYAIERYLSLEQQSARFLESGWSGLEIARNLWDLWSDDAFTPPSLRRKLDTIEPFDEWEEFALFGGHYFLLVASNTGLRKSTETLVKDAATTFPSAKTSDEGSIHVFHHDNPADASLTPRRFASAFTLTEDELAVHGGQGQQSRLPTVDAVRRENQPLGDQPCFMQGPPARMCHTITSMSDGQALLVGGRGSPTQALKDCWLSRDRAWTKVDDVAMARYRHSAVAVDFKGDASQDGGVLVFGGKNSDGTVLEDWALWTATSGWHSIPVDGDGPRPSARFGAAMSTMGAGITSGLLVGGMCQSGTVCQDVWQWTISKTPTLRLIFKDRTNDICSNSLDAAHARIGASLVPWGNSLLLIGGVSKSGIHSLSEDFLLLTHTTTEIKVRQPVMQLPSVSPLLVGMGIAAISRDEVIITGGGAVCFSMGSFWNEGFFTVTKSSMQGIRSWRPVPCQLDGTAQAKPPTAPRKGQPAKAKKNSARTSQVPRIGLRSAEDFAKLVSASKPAIIEGVDIGPCTDLWTLDYLKHKIGAERELVVHECTSDRMTFKDKNFQYVKRSTADFLDGIARGSKAYLRSTSSSQPNKLPTKLEDDFPAIAPDFAIPEIFDVVKSNLHSSPLRISGPVSLWLHYDVLSNILCQIRGNKTLYLYPPSDVKYLDYPPGGSSSNTDVLTSKDPKLRFTHPHIVSLKPGDILFIPPMWSHTATPDDGVSVAVNVFWRGLDKGYAAGKDVYGNRDLQAYENGRRDVEKIVRAFREVPVDIAGFYLDRLAGEILESAEKMRKKGREKKVKEEKTGEKKEGKLAEEKEGR